MGAKISKRYFSQFRSDFNFMTNMIVMGNIGYYFFSFLAI